MIRGDGAPVAELWEGDSLIATLTLPRPNERLTDTYDPVEQVLGTNVFGEQVTEPLGRRYHGKMMWLLTESNRAALLITVCRLEDWWGKDKRVKFQPHDDVNIWEQCEVIPSAASEKTYENRVTADEITVELIGLNVRPAKPNLAMDAIGSSNKGRV
jgi:hypothetical protein